MVLIHIIRAFLERREAIRELNAMDERLLRDIGINRQDILSAVRDGKN